MGSTTFFYKKMDFIFGEPPYHIKNNVVLIRRFRSITPIIHQKPLLFCHKSYTFFKKRFYIFFLQSQHIYFFFISHSLVLYKNLHVFILSHKIKYNNLYKELGNSIKNDSFSLIFTIKSIKPVVSYYIFKIRLTS